MHNNGNLVGVDVGGTKMHFARIEDGKVNCMTHIPTDAGRTTEAVTGDILKGIESVFDDSVTGIGIGIPGLVDTATGTVIKVNNVPCISGFPLCDFLKGHFGAPAVLGNDANCFAMGEKHYGKGKQYRDMVGLILGTGVGAGVIVNGRIYEGNRSMAGEFGGIKYLDSDFENYCSGKFFTNRYGDSALTIEQGAAAGDDRAMAICTEYGRHVGELLQTIIFSCGPEAIIMGGSLTKAYPHFRQGMRESLSRFAHPGVLAETYIDVSDDPHMPVLGAAALVIGSL